MVRRSAAIDDRMLLSGTGDCYFFAINFALRVGLLPVSGNRLVVLGQAL